ncbi:MAG TPA: glutamate--tRNA ligase [Ruminococcaceae bacterium]|nr:glutamate--tRNA ligase [Oscillospiraceae bacterium]
MKLGQTQVRTRFAPSPTGYMHVGNLRTALYTYLIAKSNEGKFILRIEDTDQERLVEGAVEVIYKTLKETGLIWDEGPDIGGPVGPYIQSERRDIYTKYADELIEKGGAYYCFCSKERLDELRKIHEASGIPHKYDGHCRDLSPEEVKRLLAEGVPHVVRQRIPAEGTTTFHDVIFGDITVENETLDDNILIKTDGLPTYNFANVVDDHLMGITHVVRGIEYLSSAPKYNLLYEAFGWEIPTYIHCPPVMRDAKHKLSKRNGDPTYEDLIQDGYLKEAVLNYVALLGWSPKGEQEIFSLEELEKVFSVDGVSKSPAIFDLAKLKWINSEYIRALPLEKFHEMALPYIKKAVHIDTDTHLIAEVLQPRCEKLTDIPEKLDFIDVLPKYDTALYVHKKMKTNLENALESLKDALPILENLQDWSRESLHDALFGLVKQKGVKNGIILWPVRVAVSGKQFTPGGAVEICELLGKEESLRRVRVGIELLNG